MPYFNWLPNCNFCELLFRKKSSSSSSDEDDKSFTSNADDYVEYPVKSCISYSEHSLVFSYLINLY